MDPTSLHLLALLSECERNQGLATSRGVLDAAFKQRVALLDSRRPGWRQHVPPDRQADSGSAGPALRRTPASSEEERRAINLLAEDAVALHLVALLWQLNASADGEELTVAAVRGALRMRLIALGAPLDIVDPMLPAKCGADSDERPPSSGRPSPEVAARTG